MRGESMSTRGIGLYDISGMGGGGVVANGRMQLGTTEQV